jgi:hypothetical protein
MSFKKNKFQNREKKIQGFSQEKRLKNFKQRGYESWTDEDDENFDEFSETIDESIDDENEFE